MPIRPGGQSLSLCRELCTRLVEAVAKGGRGVGLGFDHLDPGGLRVGAAHCSPVIDLVG